MLASQQPSRGSVSGLAKFRPPGSTHWYRRNPRRCREWNAGSPHTKHALKLLEPAHQLPKLLSLSLKPLAAKLNPASPFSLRETRCGLQENKALCRPAGLGSRGGTDRSPPTQHGCAARLRPRSLFPSGHNIDSVI